jgi:hypothetical protein
MSLPARLLLSKGIVFPMRTLLFAAAMLVSATAFAQIVTPPQSNSNTAKFLSTPGAVFVTDAKNLGNFKVNNLSLFGNDPGRDVSMSVTAVVVWDYVSPDRKLKAIRFRATGFYEGFVLDVFIDNDELADLQKYFGIFDQEAAQFKPSKDYWRRVAFESRGGLTFALEAYDDKRDLRVGVFDRSIYMLSKDREKMKNILTAGAKWLDEYQQPVSVLIRS